MAIPEYSKKQLWIPENWVSYYNKFAEWSHWYSGDMQGLVDHYGSQMNPLDRFWAEELWKDNITSLHVPIASDIASISSDLLFSEAPEIYIPEAKTGEDSEAKKTQARLEEIIQKGGVQSKLLEAGETASAMSGVFLKVDWDKNISPYPILSVVQVDNAIPEFRFGILYAVTFWRVVMADGDVVYRHLERHERGYIYNALYRGNKKELGKEIPLDSMMETDGLEEVVETGYDGMTAFYVPNRKPNKTFRGSPLGDSDFGGIEPLMDALDETYTSWLRDIRLGAGRIIVPEEWLEKTNGSLGFNMKREVFTTLGMDPVSAGQSGLTISQFAIRTEEHAKTSLELLDRIVSSAGYSPQSFGLKIEGRSESGTALHIRERRTFITKGKKEEHFRPAIEGVLHAMLHIDSHFLGSNIKPMKPTVIFQDSISFDLKETAETVNIIKSAEAGSIYTRVKRLNPQWSQVEIEEEVERIMKEKGLMKQETIVVDKQDNQEG